MDNKHSSDIKREKRVIAVILSCVEKRGNYCEGTWQLFKCTVQKVEPAVWWDLVALVESNSVPRIECRPACNAMHGTKSIWLKSVCTVPFYSTYACYGTEPVQYVLLIVVSYIRSFAVVDSSVLCDWQIYLGKMYSWFLKYLGSQIWKKVTLVRGVVFSVVFPFIQ